MPFHLLPTDDSARQSVRRIAQEQLDAALTLLDAGQGQGPDAAAVHGIRKRIKRLRGLLRLVDPVLEGAERDARRLRDAAHILGPLRDAEVRVLTLAGLADDLGGVAPAALAPFAAALEAERAAAAAAPCDLDALRDALEHTRRRARDWRLSARGFAAFAPGLAATWADARQAMDRAAAERRAAFSPDPFHRWRRRAKAHWYQARILLPIWPEMMAPHAAATDALGELLGAHNDLAVLAEHLARGAAGRDDPATFRAIAAAVRTRRTVLADRALHLGTRLFAGKPKHLTARWGAWHAARQAEP
jgi:CHAD domain-containing protein